MKLFRKILFTFLLLLLAGGITLFFIVRNVSKRALPEYNTTFKLKNLQHNVNIFRDKYAIPHIYAKTEADLYRATGFVMAQDRLWQMDLLRRVTCGKLAEIFGKDLVETDVLMRSLRISEKSKTILEKSPKEINQMLEAFADGVNQYIERAGKNLPPEFAILGYKPEKWKPEHSVNLIGYIGWDLTTGWSSEMVMYKILEKFGKEKTLDFIPNLKEQKNFIFPEFKMDSTKESIGKTLASINDKLQSIGVEVFSGSNNWAVSSAKSANGKALMANDMHLGLFAPGLWYQIHQVVEGKLNVTGVILPGEPLVVAGHNDSIAWGMTNVMSDDLDFYEEKINPTNSYEYRFNNQWRKMNVKNEIIKVKGEIDIQKELKFTHRGPLISNLKQIHDKAISMRWIGNEYSNELLSIYHFNRAGNWGDFCQAAKTFIAVSQNIVYADVKGNIGLYCCAGIPIRKGNPAFVFPGDTSAYDWQGLVPFENLPHEYNPACGFVASANSRTAPPDYPFYISTWFDLPYRNNRIREFLGKKEKISMSDMKELQTDVHSKLAEHFKLQLVSILKNMKKPDDLMRKAISELEKWDCEYSPKSSAAAIFEIFYNKFLFNLVQDELGDELFREYIGDKTLVKNLIDNVFFRNQTSVLCDNVLTSTKKETFTDIVELSFSEAISTLAEKQGEEISVWEWGKEHQLCLKHPITRKTEKFMLRAINFLFGFNRGNFALGGSYHTVCPYSYKFFEPFSVVHGASHRHLYVAGFWDESFSVIPTGQSGIPASKHYCDQTSLYVNNDYHPDLISKEKVEKNSVYKTILVKN